MNNNIKKIVVSTMMIAALSSISYTGNEYLGNIRAYASSYELTDIDMGNVHLYENSNYTKELNSDKDLKDEYYAKISSDKSKVTINTSADSDCVKITKSRSSKTYEQGDSIPVLTGKTTIYIKVYASKEDRDSDKDCKEQYKIHIKRYTSEEEEEIKNDDQEDVYLQSLELDYGDIPLGFKREKMKYDVTVDSDVKSLAIRAMPEDGAYTVRVNGIALDENKEYKKDINLSNGITEVKVTLSYGDEDEVLRTYTINITKKDKNDSSNQSNTQDNIKQESNIDEVNKENSNTEKNDINPSSNINNNNNNKLVNLPGWNKLNGRWIYNDDYGNQLKNTWFYDRNYGQTYYFDADGFMKTGWLNLGSDWYYLNENGSMMTGWKAINGKWYYFNYDGKMKTGWFKDIDGKYYYLNPSSGEMLHNTTVGGYKLGSNGAWIK